MISNELVRNDEASNITGRMQDLSKVDKLQKRNEAMLIKVKKAMGEKWICHPKNQVRRKDAILN